MPSRFASLYFEPGFSPTTTKSVFLLTEEVALPPSSLTFVSASVLDKLFNSPVNTNVFPSKTWGTFFTSSFIFTPAILSFSINFLVSV